MTYREYRETKQKEVNDLPLFFAFSNKQLDEALEKRNATVKDIYRLGDTGGFYLKKDAEIIRAYFSKDNQLPALMKDYDFAVEAFLYEMNNHEYAINWQGDWDVCAVFCDKEPEFSEDKTYVEYFSRHPETTRVSYRLKTPLVIFLRSLRLPS